MLTSTRRTLLRNATAQIHSELDTNARSLDLTNADDYGRFLLANAAPLFALEIALERTHIERVLPDWYVRSRRQALSEDLEALQLAAKPSVAPSIDGVSEQLGVLYVLEGSRLGAQSMLQQTAKAKDLRVREALRFLSASDGSLWVRFLRVLESTEYVDTRAMSRAACAAFALFGQSFASQLAKADA